MVPVILFTACTNNSEMQSLIQTKLSSINENLVTDTKNIIIIPGEGYGGCISQITSDLILGIDTLNSHVIFTGVNDKKLLRHQVGEEVLNHPLVYIDAKNVMMNHEYLQYIHK